jgi:hypothetical protein
MPEIIMQQKKKSPNIAKGKTASKRKGSFVDGF